MISVRISRRKEIVIRLPQFVKVNPSSTMMPLTNRLHYFLSVQYIIAQYFVSVWRSRLPMWWLRQQNCT